MQLQIVHETRYDYTPAVEIAQHLCHLQARQSPVQTLTAFELQIDPKPSHQHSVLDSFGNHRHFFSLQKPHAHLQVVARSTLTTCTAAWPDSEMPWEAVRDRFRYVAGQPYDAASEFVLPSPYVRRHPDFAQYALASFPPGRSVLAGAESLMHRIHADFRYESQSTQINTPALEAFAQRRGVCQDFAHIMVACLRSLGLPARYVSGYLMTRPPPGRPRLIGADASHAWVSVYVPDAPEHARWVDFCPTNDRMGCGSPGEDFVTLAVGRDFSDVSPMRGVIHGGTQHVLKVAVTVAPVGCDLEGSMP